MSNIVGIESLSGTLPTRDDDRENVDSTFNIPDEFAISPLTKNLAEKQDNKTTLQDAQYTGKGSFMDTVF
ncbi:hypothetical protein [Pseudodesulfovibrio piezophilus]|uniref:Uncharacterized protein n=1 Tax=Pseudodesulfovibrio piezophilus (strain DSM 21447 / JCM 15486 / C1TLV30) TaxID=1322246 RepID=M1WLE9_PSEP2|nr:hypothetical protein [Pseudodesulfovibrio piezophilus]CCH47745.1 conserved protein of unknown function [Pseudodesulfovibrio piezophilus C1TLV30]